MQLIDGKKIAEKRREALAKTLSETRAKTGRRPPGLAFVLVGDHPPSQIYVRAKDKACQAVGIRSYLRTFSQEVSEEKLLREIEALNADPDVDGILVQLPLPVGIDAKKVIEAVDPKKDVDGFHPLNLGKLLLGDPTGFVPCTPLGIFTLLEEEKIHVKGKHVVILGRSVIVGKPLAALLMQKKEGANATVTVAHSESLDLFSIVKSADILISAMGRNGFVKAEMVKPKAVVIDVGITRLADGRLAGDVDFATVSHIASRITPVPGGVGPMTIASLLENTWKSYLL